MKEKFDQVPTICQAQGWSTGGQQGQDNILLGL